MVDMLRHAFEQRNSSQQAYSGRMRMPLDLIPRKLRNWDLSVWELKGASDTWGGQLAEFNKKDPVFAVVSGISVSTWDPIDQFVGKKSYLVYCLMLFHRQKILVITPCIFLVVLL